MVQAVVSFLLILTLFNLDESKDFKDLTIKEFFLTIGIGLLVSNPFYYLIRFIYKTYKK